MTKERKLTKQEELIRSVLNEHREDDKKFIFGSIALMLSVLLLFSGSNILYRFIIAILIGRYGWILLKKTSIGSELPGGNKK